MGLTALLIGNGLNRAIDNQGWENLLFKLASDFQCNPDEACTSNLALEFERIYFNALKRDSEIKKYTLKCKVKNHIPNLDGKDLSLLQLYANLPLHHFLTTNYEYNLELSLAKYFNRKNFVKTTTERLHSLRRCTRLADKSIWHIHGEIAYPDSLCLGYEQYCSYLARIHDLLKGTRPDGKKGTYIRYIAESDYRDSAPESWLDIFFTHDIHIVGLSLSYVEIDLWWLVNYWAQCRFGKNYTIGNTIHYHVARDEESKQNEIIPLLKAMGIAVHETKIKKGCWLDYHTDVAHTIRKLVQK